MKIFIVLSIFLSLFTSSCSTDKNQQVIVGDNIALYQALEQVRPGDHIILSEGTWTDLVLTLDMKGTANNPVRISAETPGKVYIEGESCLYISGEYLQIEDLHFRNGHTPGKAVIQFRDQKGQVANHCRLTHIVIDHFTQPNRHDRDHWVEFYGRHNSLENSTLLGKSNRGPTLRVFLKGNESIYNYHRITGNYFGPRPRMGGPQAETMQIGDSGTSMTPSYTLVTDNYFDRCNGEVEVISSKSNFNEFRNNIFYLSEGSLVTRHGNYTIIDGNIFIGSDDNPFIGGIRLVNTGHWVTNNYFYKLRAGEFRAPLAIMNGIPKSPLNRYNQVTDAVIAHNTWVDCISPWHISVGANLESAGVLPPSEIRSERPVRTLIANNLIVNSQLDPEPLFAYDKVDGIRFEGNLIDNGGQNIPEDLQGLHHARIRLTGNPPFLVPDPAMKSLLKKSYPGFEFERIDKDLFGYPRVPINWIGAISPLKTTPSNLLDSSGYGASWFQLNPVRPDPRLIQVSETASLPEILSTTGDGDTLLLASGVYTISRSLDVMGNITLKGQSGSDCRIYYKGPADSPLFQIYPRAKLTLCNLTLEGGQPGQTPVRTAVSPLDVNMSANYDIVMSGVTVTRFQTVLHAYKGSFADSILISDSHILHCGTVLDLSAETDDKGDYNAEWVIIRNSRFHEISGRILDYYRGGYDESTIGGNILLENSVISNSGVAAKDGLLISTRGIINVDIRDNRFENNSVKSVALLWGEKNNRHSGNTFLNSGGIQVQEHLEQTLMY